MHTPRVLFLPEPERAGDCSFRAVEQSRPDAVGWSQLVTHNRSKLTRRYLAYLRTGSMTSLSATVPKPWRDPGATCLPEHNLSGQIAQTQHRVWPCSFWSKDRRLRVCWGQSLAWPRTPSSFASFSPVSCQLPNS